MFKFIRRSLLLCLLFFILAGVGFYHYLRQPLNIPARGYSYHLKPGSSFAALAYDLQRQQILSFPKLLILYARLTGLASQVHAGEYFIRPGTSAKQLCLQLRKGEVLSYPITFVEGWRFSELQAAVAKHAKINRDFDLATNAWWQRQVQERGYGSIEGLLFPDTYRYSLGLSETQLYQIAYQRMQQVLASEWQQRQDDLPYETPYQALIMASLIEKETGVVSEREQIAGVFVRRLQKNMRLQTDPTVIYGLGADFDGNLTSKHLKDSSNPYNTYRHHGLPPTPIALVGREAIHAALHPASGDSLYFVAKGDGSHYFSASLAEHNKAVKKYQMHRRSKNYRSSPPVQ
ncbi:endolytic transglycosylase MltG [Dasania sp. GY-MA-18]|uniref:Endolytic murein transglycosylase n=1 Tax=Dasania phycosphaerae TaxID=2950436 RepID=A0A9J6RJ21_9GAMM|nr:MULTISPECIES: endolytic transglycosylase MltG [Dasania]MCR8921941.1 endolytic transglycosylase MltG [Dasania sp. GY-MA-18]MCZ0864369.1 endolytic transglycosylase MltG [Dasania phycosphaerae]MCZ0868097.1 endolytic transglycosylase MltG [Dasania phycosphaerae]